MTFHIRELDVTDWKLWRDMRVRALTDSPDAFGRTVAEERLRTDADWRDRLSQANAVFLSAEREDRAVGIAAVWIDPEEPSVGNVFSMWVSPEARRHGVGQGLLDHAIRWAKAREAVSVQLTVTEGNVGAYELYRRVGFAETGRTEPLREGSSLQTLWMAREVG